MMSVCALVLGAESSGTRLLTRLLINYGFVGSDDHVQPHDSALPIADEKSIVWRRSFPHDGTMPSVRRLNSKSRKAGYEPKAIVLVRDFFALRESQQSRYGYSDEQVQSNLSGFFAQVFVDLTSLGIPFIVIPYEALVQRPASTMSRIITWLYGGRRVDVPLRDLNLDLVNKTMFSDELIEDGNAQYLDKERPSEIDIPEGPVLTQVDQPTDDMSVDAP